MPAWIPGLVAGASHLRVLLINAVVITETQELDPHLDDWDRLAVLRRQPYCAPAWMLAWWRHASPPGARLAVVIVTDDERVIGVVPLFQRRTLTGLREARMLGTGHRVDPLAEPGREHEVATAAAEALQSLPERPSTIFLSRGDAASPWPWSAGPRLAPAGGDPVERAHRVTGGPPRGPHLRRVARGAEQQLPHPAPASAASVGRARGRVPPRRPGRRLRRSDRVLHRAHHRAVGAAPGRRPGTRRDPGDAARGGGRPGPARTDAHLDASRPRAGPSAPRCSWWPMARWPTGTAATTGSGRSCAPASRRSSAPSSTRSPRGTGGSTWAVASRATSFG